MKRLNFMTVCILLWPVILLADPVTEKMPEKVMASDLYKKGVHYQDVYVARPNSGEQLEVIEFFSYACSHCYHFEYFLNEWRKTKPDNVKLTLIPVAYNKNWMVYARVYYALKEMNALQNTHWPLFEAIHKHRKPANNIEQIADIVLEMSVDRKAFLETVYSPAVEKRLAYAIKVMRGYGIRSVPVLIVNDRYATSPKISGGNDQVLKVVDYLLEKESQRLNIELTKTN